MVNTKKVRLFAALVAVMMIVAMLPVVSSAAGNTVVITSATRDAETNVVTVVGKITDDSSAGIAGQVTLLATMQAGQIEESSALLTLEEGKVAYIDQVTANADGTFKFEFLPMEGVTGKYMTIFVGGTGVEPIGADNIRNIEMPAAIGKAGTITAKEATNINGNAIEFTVNAEAADEGWIDIIEENAAVYDGETEVTEASAAYAEGTLTITGLALPADVYEKEYKLVVSGAEEFADVEVTFDVVSSVKLAADQLPATIKVEYDAANAGADKEIGLAEIAKPVIANAYGTEAAWKFVDGAESTTESNEGVTASETEGYDFALARGEEDKTYYLRVDITKDGEKSFPKVYTISVNAAGKTGPSFDSAVIDAEDAFGVEGALQIALKTEDVDPTSTKILVGTTELYYAPQRDAFIGIVEGYADIDAVLAAVNVAGTTSENVYYGKVAETTSDAVLDVFDIGQMITVFKAGAATTATVQQKLAADVFGEGSVDIFAVGNAISVMKGGNINTLFTVIGK